MCIGPWLFELISLLHPMNQFSIPGQCGCSCHVGTHGAEVEYSYMEVAARSTHICTNIAETKRHGLQTCRLLSVRLVDPVLIKTEPENSIFENVIALN